LGLPSPRENYPTDKSLKSNISKAEVQKALGDISYTSISDGQRMKKDIDNFLN
tara:strand:+ start:322 stop:480 length:159 start_codon:yes stop_codon:yes gene_type:complete